MFCGRQQETRGLDWIGIGRERGDSEDGLGCWGASPEPNDTDSVEEVGVEDGVNGRGAKH